MSNQIDLSQLTKQQLINLAWELRGTPQIQPVYRELSSRPGKLILKPDDPEWEAKLRDSLLSQHRVQSQPPFEEEE